MLDQWNAEIEKLTAKAEEAQADAKSHNQDSRSRSTNKIHDQDEVAKLRELHGTTLILRSIPDYTHRR